MLKAIFSDSTNMSAGIQIKFFLLITFDVFSSSLVKRPKIKLRKLKFETREPRVSMITFIFNIETDHCEGSTVSVCRQNKIFVLDAKWSKNKNLFPGTYAFRDFFILFQT